MEQTVISETIHRRYINRVQQEQEEGRENRNCNINIRGEFVFFKFGKKVIKECSKKEENFEGERIHRRHINSVQQEQEKGRENRNCNINIRGEFVFFKFRRKYIKEGSKREGNFKCHKIHRRHIRMAQQEQEKGREDRNHKFKIRGESFFPKFGRKDTEEGS